MPRSEEEAVAEDEARVGGSMKEEYDFSGAERGRFHRPDAEIRLPVYLDEDVAESLRQRAAAEGVELDRLVNELLRRHVAMMGSSRRPRGSGGVGGGG